MRARALGGPGAARGGISGAAEAAAPPQPLIQSPLPAPGGAAAGAPQPPWGPVSAAALAGCSPASSHGLWLIYGMLSPLFLLFLLSSVLGA